MQSKTKTKRKPMDDKFAVIKPNSDIRLDRLAAGREAVAKAKSETITLADFINQNYSAGKGLGSGELLKVTIKDIGLMPFEVDIFDARIIVVEVTGKTRKDFDGNDAPERIYKGRHSSMNGALVFIGSMVSKRRLQSLPTSNITLMDYHSSYSAYWQYIGRVIMPAYGKALDALQDKFPFTQISQGRTDRENWFNDED